MSVAVGLRCATSFFAKRPLPSLGGYGCLMHFLRERAWHKQAQRQGCNQDFFHRALLSAAVSIRARL